MQFVKYVSWSIIVFIMKWYPIRNNVASEIENGKLCVIRIAMIPTCVWNAEMSAVCICFGGLSKGKFSINGQRCTSRYGSVLSVLITFSPSQ